MWLVHNGTVVAAKMSGFITVLIVKLSELATTSGLTRKQQALFVLKAFVAQICAQMFGGFIV
jgi:hypothetical protein